jgi:hypothetical protein
LAVKKQQHDASRGLELIFKPGLKEDAHKNTVETDTHYRFQIQYNGISIYELAIPHTVEDWQGALLAADTAMRRVIESSRPPTEMDAALMAIPEMVRLRDDFEWDYLQ